MAAVHAASRYKDTPIYSDSGREIQGLFRLPVEFQTIDQTWGTVVVREADLGAPDKIAVRIYGEGREMAWWVVLVANGIIDAESEISAGTRLAVPPKRLVDSYIARKPAL